MSKVPDPLDEIHQGSLAAPAVRGVISITLEVPAISLETVVTEVELLSVKLKVGSLLTLVDTALDRSSRLE